MKWIILKWKKIESNIVNIANLKYSQSEIMNSWFRIEELTFLSLEMEKSQWTLCRGCDMSMCKARDSKIFHSFLNLNVFYESVSERFSHLDPHNQIPRNFIRGRGNPADRWPNSKCLPSLDKIVWLVCLLNLKNMGIVHPRSTSKQITFLWSRNDTEQNWI